MANFKEIKRFEGNSSVSIPTLDISPIKDMVSVLSKIDNRKKQDQAKQDNLSLIKTNNELLEYGTNLISNINETGEYKNAIDKWDSFTNNLSASVPDNISEHNEKIRDLVIQKQRIVVGDKINSLSNELQNKEIANDINKSLTLLKNNAIDFAVNLDDADLQISAMVSAIPNLSEKQKEFAIWEQTKEFTTNVVDQIIKSDPQSFLDNKDLFKNRISKSEMKLAEMAATSSIITAQKRLQSLMDDEKAMLSMDAIDNISSLKEYGVASDPALFTKMTSLGMKKEATQLLRDSEIALLSYQFKENSNGLSFPDKFVALNNLKPKSGEQNFNKKQTLYLTSKETLTAEYESYINDPVSELIKNQQNDFIDFYGKDKYKYRLNAQIQAGSKPQDLKLFTNQEKTLFVSAWKDKPQERSDMVYELSNDMPPELITMSVNELPIPSEYKTAYFLSEGIEGRTSLMYDALNKRDENILSSADKKALKADVYEYAKEDNSELSYYSKLSNITGDPNLVNLSSDMVKLMEQISYSTDLDNASDPIESARQLMFGIKNDIVSNDTLLGIDTPMTPINDNIESYLENFLQTMDSNSTKYTPIEIKLLQNGMGIWVQRSDGFYLWDESVRKQVYDKKDKPISISYSELETDFENQSKIQKEIDDLSTMLAP